MPNERYTKEDIDEIVETVINIKNSLSILCDYCQYNENNHKLMSALCLLEILQSECSKILNKF